MTECFRNALRPWTNASNSMSAIQLSLLAVQASLSGGATAISIPLRTSTSAEQKAPPFLPTTTIKTKMTKPSIHKPFWGLLGTPPDSHHSHPLRNHLVAATGEFVGTFFFLFFAFLGHSTAVYQASSYGPHGTYATETVLYVALSYGFSFLVNAWIMYRISGGLFNPAVTFALVMVGGLDCLRGLIFVPVQLLSAMSAAAIVNVMIPVNIAKVQTTLAPGVTVAQGLFLEMFLTSLLVFTVLMLAAEKWKATFMAPVGIGLALFVAELAGIIYTGASLNPARSFAPCVASADFPGYHWIYWVGPVLGGLISGVYYHFVKYFNYWEVNPGQASSGTPPVSMIMDTNLPMQHTEAVGPVTPHIRRASGGSERRRSNVDGSMDRPIQRRTHYPHHQYKQKWEEIENPYERAPGMEEGQAARRGRRYDRANLYDAGYSGAGTSMGLGESYRVRMSRGGGSHLIADS